MMQMAVICYLVFLSSFKRVATASRNLAWKVTMMNLRTELYMSIFISLTRSIWRQLGSFPRRRLFLKHVRMEIREKIKDRESVKTTRLRMKKKT